jgi:hypothetical protein
MTNLPQGTPSKLSDGHKHILRLVRRDAGPNGWTKVSRVVAPAFEDPKIPGGPVPAALCEFESQDDGSGYARLTPAGNGLLDAMEWL